MHLIFYFRDIFHHSFLWCFCHLLRITHLFTSLALTFYLSCCLAFDSYSIRFWSISFTLYSICFIHNVWHFFHHLSARRAHNTSFFSRCSTKVSLLFLCSWLCHTSPSRTHIVLDHLSSFPCYRLVYMKFEVLISLH